MNNTTEAQKFAYVTVALITLISFIHKPATIKEKKAAMSLILANEDMAMNYDFVIQAKKHIEKRLKDDFFHGSDLLFAEVRAMQLRPDFAALAIDIGVQYLKKNVKITAPKISVIEQFALDLGVPFKRHLSYWIK
ncbi:hypothetical protein C1Y41_04705 [Pantoea sp. ICBG 1758]|uniref:hypothetical protein n=1 Tax=Pantoea sp. ICBG 1758 TaxID=2071682 RepID=UPI000CE3E8C2|nr:hypothetical protein [Pantoea sp. ICBG 1758]PPC63947.1 hypothetical protein C1Y41_04705 [Pantoea sp. ICBG 1758]